MLERPSPFQSYDVDNHLANLMLAESVKNPRIKSALYEAGMALCEKILNPLQQAINDKKDINALPEYQKKSLTNCANHHSFTERQYGSVLATYDETTGDVTDFNYSAAEIIGDLSKINLLLDTLREAIVNVKTAKSEVDIVKAVKTIVDLGFCYREFFPTELKSAEYKTIDDMIWPTQSEFLVRIMRTKLGQEEQLQTAFGIGHAPGNGMSPKKEAKGKGTGGAFWGKVDMAQAITSLVKEFDETNTRIENFSDKALQDEFVNLKKKRDDLQKQMDYLHIPLDPKERKPLFDYHKTWKTSLEKLAQKHPGYSDAIVASVSGSTARPLVALQDLGAFNKTDGELDLDKAQMLTNCIMAFFVKAGHHSFDEVAEIYNRLLDYWAIYKPTQLPLGVRITITEYQSNRLTLDKQQGEKAACFNAERILPYFDYLYRETFFHASYAKNIVSRDQLQALEHLSLFAHKVKEATASLCEAAKKVPVAQPTQSFFSMKQPSAVPDIRLGGVKASKEEEKLVNKRATLKIS